MAQARCEQVMHGHPCYGGEAYHRYGRIHLPVAPKCNIQCNYCVRRLNCANENRPGVTSAVLSPRQALDRVRAVVTSHRQIRVAGIAGPGDPLANDATFETFGLIHQEFPDMIKCFSTNGLRLSEKLEELLEVGVSSVTVTINSVDPSIGKLIYSWVRYGGRLLRGEEAAELLCEKQFEGIKEASLAGMAVRVNTVLIPEINGDHLIEVAQAVAEAGVDLMNIIPLIPLGAFSNLRSPTKEELRDVQNECEVFVRQFIGCRQCRADAVGMLSRRAL